jgi:RNA polymerase sigma-32 factor
MNMALAELDDRERAIVEARYLSEDPLQLKELGEQLGVSKQRVAQIEKRALLKMKGFFEAAQLEVA